MKRLLSLALTCMLTALLIVPAFGAPACTCGNTPLIVVSGMNTYPMMLADEAGEEVQVFPPDIDVAAIVVAALKGLGMSAATLDINALLDALLPVAWDILGDVACDENGNSVQPITVQKFDTSMAQYLDIIGTEGSTNEHGLLQEACGRYGADHVYFFNYNWRLDPLEHARELHELILTAKRETGHSRVNLAPCSMGGVQVLSYLYLYGSAELESIAFLSSTFYGAYVATDLFQKRVSIDGDNLQRYISHNMDGVGRDILAGILQGLDTLGLLDAILNLADALIAKLVDRVYAELLIPIFGTMPGLWSLVDPAQYEDAKAVMLDEELHAGLIARTDELQKNVTSQRETLLLEAAKDTKIIVFSHYNIPNIPLYDSANVQADGILDACFTSGGAIAANMGETLGEAYTQQQTGCGHNHLSADGVVDASTCLFPEYTWFFKGVRHVGVKQGKPQSAFLLNLLDFDGQPTVHTAGFYGQFLTDTGDWDLAELGYLGEEPATDTPPATEPATQSPAKTQPATQTPAHPDTTAPGTQAEIPQTGDSRALPAALTLCAALPAVFLLLAKRRRLLGS